MEGFDAFARNYNHKRMGDPLGDTRILIVVIQKGAGVSAVPEKLPAEQKPTAPLSTLNKEDKKKTGRAPGSGGASWTRESRLGVVHAETLAALFAGAAGGILAAAILAALGIGFGGG